MVGRSPGRHLVHGARLLLDTPITPAQLPAIRLRVDGIARDCGLAPDEASDWVTAVNELMANAIRHGGGTGRLRVWADGGLHCEVCDSGPGFAAAPYVAPRDRPVPSVEGGMGLWIARQMTDAMEIDSGPSGTVVRVSTRIHRRA